MKQKIAILSLASLSPLGSTPDAVWEAYLSGETSISQQGFEGVNQWVATMAQSEKQEMEALRQSAVKYKALDETVLLAILASRRAVSQAGWKNGSEFGINIGSSRGATQLFEKHHAEFLQTGKTPTLTSPTTTLGNIASWVAHDLKSQGPEISHSITCSTALHAVLNAVAWLQSGMAKRFLVGGSEAPLTAFTLAQMHALKIYSKEKDEGFPCRAFDLDKTKNSMVLGEAAASACLEVGQKEAALGYIAGIGYATDTLQHNISISEEAECFQQSMKMALGDTHSSEVDAIVMHAPGTLKGDLSEYKAISKLFSGKMPMLTTNKWQTGHTFGASGMLNMELALLMMQHDTFIPVPFGPKQLLRNEIRNVLVNAVGFGGNAVSILLTKAY